MPKSYRIRTEVGKDKAIQVSLEQDFEYLEILSLKILQNDIYTRVCSDYGVVVGRLSVNNGLGLPNCKVSIFIPLSQEDENDAIISELYPYKTLNDVNDEGYRYNLLPYTKSHGGHRPTGTFPTRNDVLTNQTLIEVYDKYYKFTAKTNDSGDFMIFGVPLGTQTIHIDVDLSDIGEFSMTPQDLVRIGLATESQVSGTEFKTSSNLGELPQILQFNRIIEVFPLWGQPEVCTLGITRSDFDLTEEASITLEPAAVFMGSIFSNQDKRAVKKKCRVNRKLGNLCQLIAGPGEILSIRQTIGLDSAGLPILEEFQIGEGGKVIDDNGTWLVDLPMNLDFVYTNEFGERTFSSDPKVGVPTKAKYRFKVKWEQPQTLQGKVKRASFLVPNIKEWGWSSTGNDPYTVDNTSSTVCDAPNPNDFLSNSFQQVAASYAFSLDWNDYGAGTFAEKQQMIQEAVSCQDRFYEFNYNKVYTVAELISEYRSNSGNKKFIAVRDVLDETCENTNNPFPVNDAIFQFDILYLLFSIVALILKPILILILFISHIVAWVICKIKDAICDIKGFLCKKAIRKIIGGGPCNRWKTRCKEWEDKCEGSEINLPLLTYPDCELCQCTDDPAPTQITGALAIPNQDTETSYPPTVFFPWNEETDIIRPSLLPLLNFDQPSNFICDTATGTATTPSPDKRTFTMSIPFPEKANLFNTKAKFFDEQPGVVNPRNPGGGVNRIKVWFNVGTGSTNDINSQYHYDNVFAMVIPPIPTGTTIDTGPPPYLLQQGDLLKFSKALPPTDPNMLYYTGITNSGFNPYGTKGVTGITDPSWTLTTHPDGALDEDGNLITGYTFLKTITYANYEIQSSLQTPQLSTTYQIFISSADTMAQRFSFDDEFFQVIYTGTVGNFLILSEGSAASPNSFANRFLNGQMLFVTNDYTNQFEPVTIENPDLCTMTPRFPLNCSNLELENQTTASYTQSDLVPNFSDYRVIFMVRGVDPHSTKVSCRYDLSALFGFTLAPPGGTFNVGYTTTFMAHMNIPIQPTLRATKHNLPNSTSTDVTYSNNKLFFDTFGFIPDPNQFQTFYSQKPFNYSSLDQTNAGGAPAVAYQSALQSNFAGALLTPYTNQPVLTINATNNYTKELWFNFSNTILGGPNLSYYNPTPILPIVLNSDENTLNTTTNDRNRGYFKNEVIEGGSLLHIPDHPLIWNFGDWTLSVPPGLPIIPPIFITACDGIPQHNYYGQKYSISAGLEINSGSSGRQLVMRSDRLPVSDTPNNVNTNGESGGPTPVVAGNNINSMIGFSNPLFVMSVLNPAGEIETGIPGPSDNAGDNAENQDDITSVGSGATDGPLARVASSFSCEGIRPLDCYQVDNSTGFVYVLGPGDACGKNTCCNDDSSTSCSDCNGEDIIKFGCYTLITDPWKSRKLDKYLVNEWLLRLRISFAACRNVWGHMFTNQWVNGTLFAFPFQVQTKFTSPSGSDPLGPNQPYACYCTHNAYFDFKTNNFYYRVTPYNQSTGFIGRDNKGGGFGGNKKILGNPTTIMDLGPVNDYMDELSYSEDFLGYVADRLDSTSFQDVDELLNLFIIQRLVSASIRDIIRSSAKIGTNKDPVKRYFSRNNNKVDGDYAQMLAINSQIGVVPYDSSIYTDPFDIFFSSSGLDSGVFGVFFSANTQVRDWISPKRTIVSPGSDPLFTCTFDEFPVFSQEIPMYLWQIKAQSTTPNDNIFGNQVNDWYTEPISSSQFNSIPYQSIDRIEFLTLPPYESRIMQPHFTDSESFYPGYIYNIADEVVGGVNFSAVTTAAKGDMASQGPTGPTDRIINNTAPFYFYFGLIKGSSAYDRFLTKWVKKDTNKY